MKIKWDNEWRVLSTGMVCGKYAMITIISSSIFQSSPQLSSQFANA